MARSSRTLVCGATVRRLKGPNCFLALALAALESRFRAITDPLPHSEPELASWGAKVDEKVRQLDSGANGSKQ